MHANYCSKLSHTWLKMLETLSVWSPVELKLRKEFLVASVKILLVSMVTDELSLPSWVSTRSMIYRRIGQEK